MGHVIYVDQQNPKPADITLAATYLNRGCVLILPTDSVYGIGCAAKPGNYAHEEIFEIKQRPADMKLPWLVADVSDLMRFGRNVPDWAVGLAERYWPGALTLVVEASAEVGEEYRAADGTIALRCPDSRLVRELARTCGPLAVTSANTHGEEAATSGAAVDEALVEAADLTLDAGPAPVGVPSTIVKSTGPEPVILRQGAIEIMSQRVTIPTLRASK